MTLQEILDGAQALGIIGLLLAVLIGGARRWWVFGWYAERLEAENAELKAQLDRGVSLAERATKVAEKHV